MILQSRTNKFSFLILAAAFGVFVMFSAPASGESCMELADVPLEISQIMGPPGLIMFIFDNSGSMDWELMTENLAGEGTLADDPDAGFDLQQFDGNYGYEYIFDTDQSANTETLETDGRARDQFLWKARWHGYNKLYYNPAIEYQPWPKWVELANASQDVLNHPNNEQPDPPDTTTNGEQAHPDNPRIRPMDNTYTYDLTSTFATLIRVESCADASSDLIVDDMVPGEGNSFSATHNGTSSSWGTWQSSQAYPADADSDNYHYTEYSEGGTKVEFKATWTTSNLEPTKQYHVYARWVAVDSRSDEIVYTVYDGTVSNQTELIRTTVNQRTNSGDWVMLSTDGPLSFSGSTGIVQLLHEQRGDYGERACADAVKFVEVPEGSGTATIYQRHYYVHNQNGTFLVNLNGTNFEYYKVCDANNNVIVENGELVLLTNEEAEANGIAPGRSYEEEEQNFANWFSFYRKRDYTARYALAQVIIQMSNVLFGFSTIPEREDLGVRWIDAEFDGQYFDDTLELLNRVYMLSDPASGTPLRKGMNKVGKYFEELGGTFASTADKNALGIYSDGGSTYPFFTAEWGGECQQAFAIMMTDGAYNGQGPNIPNADGDNNTEFDGGKFADAYEDTLADGAMQFYETDLKTNLDNKVPTNYADDNRQQHMVTYALSYGIHGTKDPANWPDCQKLSCTDADTCCPDWPQPTINSLTTLDDLYHATVNGRGLYLNAANPPELIEALMRIKADIEFRLGSAAAVTTNAVQRQIGAKVYQGQYFSGTWWGDLLSLPVNVDTGQIQEAEWSAKDELAETVCDNRTIFTYNGTDGVPFRYNSLSVDQQNALQEGLTAIFGDPPAITAEQLVAYLRGDHDKEEKNGGRARNREGKLGDIVHSEPFYHDGVVYIGANDGMLHAFDASNGQELFAYVPSMVYDHLADLANPEYEHKYYVDATPYARDVSGTQTLLAGGLGKGGKGVYCLDVTNAATATEASAANFFLWEADGSSDEDMGYVYGQAYIAKTEAGWAVIFGNGYNSDSGEAVLYVLDAFDGSVLKKFETGVSGCNGMSSPTLIDPEFDGTINFVYAGDLNGNLWKFDLTGSDPAAWEIAYNDGTNPKPLFTARNENGDIQPITSEVDVIPHCQADKDGYIVIFGTGQYLNQGDLTDTTTQSVYGIWDWLDELKSRNESSPEQKYLGSLSTDTPRFLTNLNDDPVMDGKRPTLVEQTVVYDDADWRILSQNPVYYYPQTDPEAPSVTHLGWYFDLPDSGERVFEDPMIRKGIAVFVTTSPQEDPCSAGGNSILYQVSACSGGRTNDSQFDVNKDEKLDSGDEIGGKTATGMKVAATLYAPVELPPDKLYLNDATGKIWEVSISENPPGILYWRMIE